MVDSTINTNNRTNEIKYLAIGPFGDIIDGTFHASIVF